MVSIFLQSPEKEGGYGFTPNENAECVYPCKKSDFGSTTHGKRPVNFSQWAGLLVCQICGMLLNDRVPLWISRRSGGAWHLEYRLYPILLIAAASPIGFGIFGAGIQYAHRSTNHSAQHNTQQHTADFSKGIISTSWFSLSVPSSSSSAPVTARPYQ